MVPSPGQSSVIFEFSLPARFFYVESPQIPCTVPGHGRLSLNQCEFEVCVRALAQMKPVIEGFMERTLFWQVPPPLGSFHISLSIVLTGPWGAGPHRASQAPGAACMVMPCLEKSLRLGKGNLDLYFWASNLLLPNLSAFWKRQLFFCFEESRRKMCVRTAGRSLAISWEPPARPRCWTRRPGWAGAHSVAGLWQRSRVAFILTSAVLTQGLKTSWCLSLPWETGGGVALQGAHVFWECWGPCDYN